MPSARYSAFADHYRDQTLAAWRWRERGGRVVACVGADVPRELILAAGMLPVRLAADPHAATPLADEVVDAASLGWRGRALLQQLLDPAARAWDAVVIAHDVAEHAQLFAALRELGRLGHPLPPVRFADLLHLPHQTTTAYNRARVAQLHTWLADLAGATVQENTLRAAVAAANRQRKLLAGVVAWRAADPPRLSGTQALQVTGAAMVMPVEEHTALLDRLLEDAGQLPAHPGRRLLVTGGAPETAELYALVERAGAVVVGEDHDRGDAWYARLVDPQLPPLDALARHAQAQATTAATRSVAERVDFAVTRALDTRAEAALHVTVAGDDAAPWEVPRLRTALAARGIPLLAVTAPPAPVTDPELGERIAAYIDDPAAVAAAAAPRGRTTPGGRAAAGGGSATTGGARAAAAGRPSGGSSEPVASADAGARPGRRSRKSLESVATFGAYQRAWFAQVRERAAAGEPLAVVNADAPQEILRALDIPYVVNQWWASVVAAKQATAGHQQALRDHGYPTGAEPYSAQGLAAALTPDPAAGPWGGLPTPTILQAATATDATRRLFEVWAETTGAELYLLERSVDSRWELPEAWWDELPHRWDTALEPERLDLLTAELVGVTGRLEAATGRRLDPAAFAQVMDLVNEQEEYYRRTRDLIAQTSPAPVSVVDTMPATMVPQWHRGTEWGRDAARALYEEVAARAATGAAACPGERLRLLWVGRGLWGDMGFYQRFEASHGAVFVWSMYLGLAADGYLRYFDGGRDPLRALAARFATVGDELRMPTWAGAWHVKEARRHRADAAVAIADADPFVLRALERAGIPVLRLPIGNLDRQAATGDLEDRVAAFLDTLRDQRR